MAGLNMWEITLLVALAVIMFGPEKIPDVARKVARVIHFLRGIANDATSKLREELGPEYADLQLSDLNPRTFVAKHLLSAEEVSDLREIRDEFTSTKTAVEQTVADARSIGDASASDDAVTAEPEAVRVPFDPEAT